MVLQGRAHQPLRVGEWSRAGGGESSGRVGWRWRGVAGAEEEEAAVVVVLEAYYDYLGGINKTKQQTVERWYRV